jgi:carboxylate-amine ligase
MPCEDDYLVYTFNRFQACRFGLEAMYVDPQTSEHVPLREHLLTTLRAIAPYMAGSQAQGFHEQLRQSVNAGQNDARWLREAQTHCGLLPEVVRRAAQRFRTPPA